jgi:hypothetical protein
MTTVKLQLLLVRRMQVDDFHEIERGLVEIGATVTAQGAITLSCTMAVERFEAVFGRPFSGRSGFVPDALSAEDLPVPKHLAAWVESITETPVHERISNRSKGRDR